MNWLDIILIIWLISSLFSGFKMGFIYKLGSLIGLVAGLWVSSRFTPSVATWFGGGVFASMSAFFFLLSLTSHLFGLLAWGADKLFSIVRIIPFVTTINRALGAVLSVVVTAFFLSASLYVLSALPIQTGLESTIAESRIAQAVLKLSVLYKPVLSSKLEDYLHL
jgi:uncharacterized membrane protein required for colicin V production